MTSKHRRERDNEPDMRVKRQRRRKRSRSEPGLIHDPIHAEKREVLKRLFGRNCIYGFEAANNSNNSGASGVNSSSSDPGTSGPSYQFGPSEGFEEAFSNAGDTQNFINFGDENADPLLDSVPVNLDPEQLGFLVCAQETLRFLNGRGIPVQHPVFTNLRSRLLRGMDEMAVA